MAKDLASGSVVPQAASSRRSAFNSQAGDQDLTDSRPEPNLQPRAVFWATSHQCSRIEALKRLRNVCTSSSRRPASLSRSPDVHFVRMICVTPLISASRCRCRSLAFQTTPNYASTHRRHARKPSTYCTRTGQWFWHSARSLAPPAPSYPRLT